MKQETFDPGNFQRVEIEIIIKIPLGTEALTELSRRLIKVAPDLLASAHSSVETISPLRTYARSDLVITSAEDSRRETRIKLYADILK